MMDESLTYGRGKKRLPKGVRCQCKQFVPFSTYVYAHWNLELTQTCNCGRILKVKRGRVVSIQNAPIAQR